MTAFFCKVSDEIIAIVSKIDFAGYITEIARSKKYILTQQKHRTVVSKKSRYDSKST